MTEKLIAWRRTKGFGKWHVPSPEGTLYCGAKIPAIARQVINLPADEQRDVLERLVSFFGYKLVPWTPDDAA